MFYIGVSWWFFTGVWVTVSFFESLGLFSVFWLILIMLSSRWSPLVLWFLSLPVPLPSLYGIVPRATITIGISVTFLFHSLLVLSQGLGTYLSFCFLLFLLWSARSAKSNICQFVHHVPLGIFPFCYLLTPTLEKRIFAQNICTTDTISILIQYQYTDQVLLIYPRVPKIDLLDSFSFHFFENHPI